MATNTNILDSISQYSGSSVLRNLAGMLGANIPSNNKPSKPQKKSREEVDLQLAQSLSALTNILKERASFEDAPKRTLRGDIQNTFVKPFVDIKEYLTGKPITEKQVKPTDTGSLAPKTELPMGIEPNSEEEKQQDREKLADAIAKKMEIVLNNMDFCCGGLDIPLPGGGRGGPGSPDKKKGPQKNGKTGRAPGKVPAPSSGASKIGRALAAVGAASIPVDLALSVLTPYMLAAEEKDKIRENPYADEYKDNPFAMVERGEAKTENEAATQNIRKTVKALRRNDVEQIVNSNLSDNVIKEEFGKDRAEFKQWLNDNQEKEAIYQPPVKPIAAPTDIPSVELDGTGPGSAEFARRDPRRLDIKSFGLVAKDRPLIIPEKTSELIPKDISSLSGAVDKVTATNLDLKMFTPGGNATIAQPIISNKTINNTEQTLVGSSPSPFNNSNSLMNWQNSRSNFIDR